MQLFLLLLLAELLLVLMLKLALVLMLVSLVEPVLPSPLLPVR